MAGVCMVWVVSGQQQDYHEDDDRCQGNEGWEQVGFVCHSAISFPA